MKHLRPSAAVPWQHRRRPAQPAKQAQPLPPLVQRLLERVA